MKLFIVGATGRTGHHVVDQALEVEHEVTAFVRAKKTLVPTPHLNIIEGDLRDVEALSAAMRGHDAVICCLGTERGQPETLPALVGAIIEAMAQAQVGRILYMASAGIDKEIGGIAGSIVTLLLRKELRAHKQSVALLKASGLDFTIARPMQLTDGPRTRAYRTALDTIPLNGRKISRADVADFLLQSVEQGKYRGQSVGLAD